MKKLRIGDPVIVIAGKHKGKVSTIQSFADDGMVYVKGVNEVKRAKKGEGFITKTLPIHISNVMYYVEKDSIGSKVVIKVDVKGKRSRVLKSSGVTIA